LIELPSISICGGFVSSLEEKYAASVLDEFRTIPYILSHSIAFFVFCDAMADTFSHESASIVGWQLDKIFPNFFEFFL
jgi:hypothetical protein